METKQLANILIKVLGLSAFVHAIPGLITGLYSAVRIAQIRPAAGPGDWWPVASLVSMLVLAAIGIYLIIQSRQVTALLFKSDEK